MLEITNTKVYDLEESVIACRNAMRTEQPEYTKDEFEKSLERAKKLVKAGKEGDSCHSNFLTGIRVSFDLKYTQYITKQFQRYHWFDYVSSSSLMHKLCRMKVSESCNEYVTDDSVRRLQDQIDLYNKFEEMDWKDGESVATFTLRNGETKIAHTKQEALYYQYMICISNCPMGMELFVRVSTNYKQLQTIYSQRKNHKLKEDWGAFCKWVESLPYANEFLI